LDLTDQTVITAHISSLRRFKTTKVSEDDDLLELVSADQGEWIVQSIVAHRLIQGKSNRKLKSSYELKVQWSGFEGTNHEFTWGPFDELKHNSALHSYIQTQPGYPFDNRYSLIHYSFLCRALALGGVMWCGAISYLGSNCPRVK
jgi:hypothetical protein